MGKVKLGQFGEHRFSGAAVLLLALLLIGVGAFVRLTPSYVQSDTTGLALGTVTTPNGGLVLLTSTTVVAMALYLAASFYRR